MHETGNLKNNHVPLCPPVLLMASARFHRPEENNQTAVNQLDQTPIKLAALIKYESIFCYCNAYFSPQMFSETSCSVLFSCKNEKVCDPAAVLRSVEKIPSTAHQPEQNFLTEFTAKQFDHLIGVHE